MRRILLLVTVAAVMAALVVLAGPGFAAPGGQSDNEPRATPRETGGTPSQSDRVLGEKAPPTLPPGSFKRAEQNEERFLYGEGFRQGAFPGKQVFTGPF